MFYRLIRTDNDPAALIMRLALGLVIFPHGAQKVLGWWGGYGAAATIQGFSKGGLPVVLAVLVLAAEFGGSLGLIVGFLTRVAAFGVGCVMLGAILLVHLRVGFFMNLGGNTEGRGFRVPHPGARPGDRPSHQGRRGAFDRRRDNPPKARIGSRDLTGG